MAGLMLMSMPTECAARQWSLKDCIDYALANNIQLQKAKVQQLSALEDIKQSQSALLPSLSLSVLTRCRATGLCGTADKTPILSS